MKNIFQRKSKTNAKVFIAGTFDLFHIGHQWIIKTAQQYGIITAIVAREKTVERIKKQRPVNSESKRLQRVRQELAGYSGTHTAIMGSPDANFVETLKKQAPDIIVLGYDQQPDIGWIRKAFPHLRIVRATAYKPELFKSSVFRYTQNR